MRGLIDQEVPADQPGLLSYDHYWDRIRRDGTPALTHQPDVREVMEKSNMVKAKSCNTYRGRCCGTWPCASSTPWRPRLTTDDIKTPIGATAEELRDSLLLYQAMPEMDPALLLLDQVHVALREIMHTVGCSVYLLQRGERPVLPRPDKVEPVDENIQERGAALGK